MPAPLKILVLLAGFHSGSYAHAFTSLSPVAENQVRVNHLIRFQQSMSNPTNEPSREPICEPTNDWKKSEPIVSYSQIKRDKSTPTFQLVVAFVSNNNALSFNDKPSSKFELVVASVANGFSKGLSKKLSSKSEASSLVRLVVGVVVGLVVGFASKHSPPQGYIVRRIVLAVTRPPVSIRVMGLGFEHLRRMWVSN